MWYPRVSRFRTKTASHLNLPPHINTLELLINVMIAFWKINHSKAWDHLETIWYRKSRDWKMADRTNSKTIARLSLLAHPVCSDSDTCRPRRRSGLPGGSGTFWVGTSTWPVPFILAHPKAKPALTHTASRLHHSGTPLLMPGQEVHKHREKAAGYLTFIREICIVSQRSPDTEHTARRTEKDKYVT